MSDSVKFIFKTLIKVPVLIFIAYMFLNIFAFFFIYFKTLGLSYVVMQETVENNFMTQSEFNQMNDYLEKINEIPLVVNASIIYGKGSDGKPVYCPVNSSNRMTGYSGSIHGPSGRTVTTDSAFHKSNYGTAKTVGIHCEFKIVWPLDYNIANRSVANNTTQTFKGAKNKVIMKTKYKMKNDYYNKQHDNKSKHKFSVKIPLNIYYTVPGLRYYAREE